MVKVNAFNTKLIKWYSCFQRDLPWRKTKEPYNIWLSEILLQQTRISQGLKYYQAFVYHFPSVHKLADASQHDVLKLWQGLGYYTRARNLHKTAKIVVEQYNGIFPKTYQELLKLPGIGRYTAAAIASFAYEEPVPVIDGNVYRFFSRLKSIEEPVGTEKSYTLFYKLLSSYIQESTPSLFNQAIMEFGALHCTALNPKCTSCPFSDSCIAFQFNKTELYPVRQKKQTIKKRYFYYFFMTDGTNTLLNKRTKNDIWKGLYDFPLHENKKPISENKIKDILAKEFSSGKFRITDISKELRHQLTHRLIIARFVTVSFSQLPYASDYIKINMEELQNYAIPRLIEIFCMEKSLF
jgi:A/G-specific adenine glycosylase